MRVPVKLRPMIVATLTALLICSKGCSVSPAPQKGYRPLDVRVEHPGVRLLRQGMTVCLIRTDLPNVEKWEVVNRNTEIIIKSRGDRGPAAVELFDTQSGILKAKVMEDAIADGYPHWASGFGN
jgi:hypothetical protein